MTGRWPRGWKKKKNSRDELFDSKNEALQPLPYDYSACTLIRRPRGWSDRTMGRRERKPEANQLDCRLARRRTLLLRPGRRVVCGTYVCILLRAVQSVRMYRTAGNARPGLGFRRVPFGYGSSLVSFLRRVPNRGRRGMVERHGDGRDTEPFPPPVCNLVSRKFHCEIV